TTAPSSVVNNAAIATTTTETTTADNSDSATTTITRPNVYVRKTGPTSAATGSTFAYTLAYGNNGAASAATVSLVDTPPPGLAFVSASPAPSSVSGQTLTWDLGSLAAGSSGAITLNVSVSASAPASVTNAAAISTSTSETTPGDNTSSATTTINRPEVAIDK